MLKIKIKSLLQISKIAAALKKRGKKIVTTNGVFDILHPGHVLYLEQARQLGDVLIVGINSDASVRINKGKHRPITNQNSRATVLAALASVDYVFIFNEKDPRAWLAKIKPHIHVKASDYKMHEIIEKAVVEKHHGKIVLIKIKEPHSTTAIINKIKNLK